MLLVLFAVASPCRRQVCRRPKMSNLSDHLLDHCLPGPTNACPRLARGLDDPVIDRIGRPALENAVRAALPSAAQDEKRVDEAAASLPAMPISATSMKSVRGRPPTPLPPPAEAVSDTCSTSNGVSTSTSKRKHHPSGRGSRRRREEKRAAAGQYTPKPHLSPHRKYVNHSAIAATTARNSAKFQIASDLLQAAHNAATHAEAIASRAASCMIRLDPAGASAFASAAAAASDTAVPAATNLPST